MKTLLRPHLLSLALVLSAAGPVACAAEVALDDRPCPCSSGWTCCASQNVCVAPGTSCPDGPTGIGSLGSIGADGGLGGLASDGGPKNPVELATAQSARCLTTDREHVYWQNADGLVVGSDKAGGRIKVSALKTPLAQNELCGMAVDGDVLLTTSYGLGKVVSLSLSSNGEWAVGGSLSVFGGALVTPSSLAIDPEAVFVTEHDAGRVTRVPRSRAQSLVLATGLTRPHGILALGEYVYFLERGDGTTLGAIKRVKKEVEGGAVDVIAANLKSPEGLAVWDGMLYVSADGDVLSVPMAGGTPKKIAQGGRFGGVAIFGDIFFGSTTHVMRAPLTGGAASELYEGLPIALAVDEGRVYWSSGSSVFSGKR